MTRLRVVAAAAAVGVLVMVVGLGLWVVSVARAVGAAPAQAAQVGTAPAGDHRREVLAAPMARYTMQEATGGAPAGEPAEPLRVPPSSAIGAARVPSGYPHSPQGAVAQLAAIETAVFTQMDVAGARAIYDAWSQPGGVGAGAWPLTGHVKAFLPSKNYEQRKDSMMRITVTPTGAQVKGTDGPDWVVACVLVNVAVVGYAGAQAAFGYCEAMAWDGGTGRWVIAAGPSAAAAPSTWPGTAAAKRAGWLRWVQEGS